MATDPFVAPVLGDRPRQRQNLAPGVDYPPAESWEADRAGDLPTGQPDGELFGQPGPGLGYAGKLARIRFDRMLLLDSEDEDDVLAVVAELAMRRASLVPRQPVVFDVDVAVTLLGYDVEPASRDFEWRLRAVAGAHHEWERRRRIVSSVPENLLRLDPDQVAARAADFHADLGPRLYAAGA